MVEDVGKDSALQFRHEVIGDTHSLEVEVNGQVRGGLDYYWGQDEGRWELEQINVPDEYQRRGFASSLLQEFVRRIGPGQPIHGVVIHKDSVEMLKKKYPDITEGKKEIRGEELQDIPIVRVLAKGGIRVDRITFRRNPGKIPTEIPYVTGIFGTML